MGLFKLDNVFRTSKISNNSTIKALDKLGQVQTTLEGQLDHLNAESKAALKEALASKTKKGKVAAANKIRELEEAIKGVEMDLQVNRQEQRRLREETSTAHQAKILYKAEQVSKANRKVVDVKKMGRNRDRVSDHAENLEEMKSRMREGIPEGIEDIEDVDDYLAERLAELEDEELENLPRPPTNLPKPPTNQAQTTQVRTHIPARKLTAMEQKAREEAEELERLRADME